MTRRARYDRRARRPQVRFVQRTSPRGEAAFVAEVRSIAEAGNLARIHRFGRPPVDIAINGTLWLAMPWPLGDEGPIGSFSALEDAIQAGDRWAEATAKGDGGDDQPRGAA